MMMMMMIRVGDRRRLRRELRHFLNRQKSAVGLTNWMISLRNSVYRCSERFYPLIGSVRDAALKYLLIIIKVYIKLLVVIPSNVISMVYIKVSTGITCFNFQKHLIKLHTLCTINFDTF